MLSAASLLQVSGVRDACCVFLRAALAPDNALGIRAFADLHACKQLAHAALDYIHAHFEQVSAVPSRPVPSHPTHSVQCSTASARPQVLDTEEFIALEPDTLAQLLDSDRIMVRRRAPGPGPRAPAPVPGPN